jgi:uncharacterized protein (TIGR00288 family)
MALFGNILGSRKKEDHVAIFLDSPNIIRKEFSVDLKKIMEMARKRGNVRVAKAFLNQYASEKLIEALANQGFEPVVSISADIDLDMAVEAMEAVHNPEIDTIILVTRDSDYLPVMRKAKEYGKTTGVFAVNSAFSIALRNSADFVELLDAKDARSEI